MFGVYFCSPLTVQGRGASEKQAILWSETTSLWKGQGTAWDCSSFPDGFITWRIPSSYFFSEMSVHAYAVNSFCQWECTGNVVGPRKAIICAINNHRMVGFGRNLWRTIHDELPCLSYKTVAVKGSFERRNRNQTTPSIVSRMGVRS